MKKIKYLIGVFVVVFLLTGCGSNNSSPDKVAVEMAKRLSNGDYKNIEELLYFEDNGFIDSTSFRNYLTNNKLLIEGNKKNEFVSSVTDETGENSVVKVSIDNNRILEVKAVKKDDNWYVNLGEENYDENLIISVPNGFNVYLNNKQLDRKIYAKNEVLEKYWTVSNTRYDYKYSADVYTIPKLLKGTYDIKIEGNDIDTITEKIHSNINYFNSSLKDDNSYFGTSKNVYLAYPEANTKFGDEIEKFIKEYYNDLFTNSASGQSFDSMKKYFNTNKEEAVTLGESKYKIFVNNLSDTSYSTFSKYKEDLKATFDFDTDAYGIYYIEKNRYIVVAKVDINFNIITRYDTGFYSKPKDDLVNNKNDDFTVLYEVEKIDGNYVINGGVNLMPKIY